MNVEEQSLPNRSQAFQSYLLGRHMHPSMLSKCALLRKELDSDFAQSTDRPSREVLLIVVELRKEALQERRISVFDDRCPYTPHEIQLIVHVVHRKQVCSCRLLRRDVVDEGPSNAETSSRFWPTTGAFACFRNRPKVICISYMS